MKKIISTLSLTGIALLFAASVQGTPLLQLDISGGRYDTGTETIVATASTFTLYALLTPQQNTSASELQTLLNDTYYISVAIVPQFTSNAVFDVGSFTFDGHDVNATNGSLTFGSPPLHDLDGGRTDAGDLGDRGGDLPGHGIFDTFYTEFALKFDTDKTAAEYNTQDNPGGFNTSGTGAYYQEFSIDTTGLIYPYTLHFDLYETNPEYEDVYTFDKVCNKWKDGTCTAWKTTRVQNGPILIDYDVNKFAPFSHDAEGKPSNPVPEPQTMLLLGSGLIGLAGTLRRNKRAA